jgi:hypothetical protein
MTRDFIFDADSQVIGYRCRVMIYDDGPIHRHPVGLCPARPFNSAKGLQLHQSRVHGLHQQLTLIPNLQTANLGRKKK